MFLNIQPYNMDKKEKKFWNYFPLSLNFEWKITNMSKSTKKLKLKV
jgi:hypothetical protein